MINYMFIYIFSYKCPNVNQHSWNENLHIPAKLYQQSFPPHLHICHSKITFCQVQFQKLGQSCLRRVFKLILARWYSWPIKMWPSENQPIRGRAKSIIWKTCLSCQKYKNYGHP